MKKILLISIVIITFNLNAQVQNKFRVGLDVGYISAEKTDFGLSFALEPKFNIKKNMNIGLRLASVAAFRNAATFNNVTSAFLYGNSSILGTFDYYFVKPNASFVPFIGGGIGLAVFENKFVTDVRDREQSKLNNTSSGLGLLVRGGFEYNKFRFGIDYNYVPSSNAAIDLKLYNYVNDPNDPAFINNSSVTFSNAYVGIHVGFYLGGGKWGK